jgi:hypothetical protein
MLNYPDYATEVGGYRNTEEGNDAVFAAFSAATAADPLLSSHRAHVESNQLGYGDPAFHALWACLLTEAAKRFNRVRALEIGVYKGQVISLWALLGKELALDLEIHAVTPVAGKPLPKPSLWRSLRYRLDRNFREHVKVGNFHPEEDYDAIIREHFSHHQLSFDEIKLHRGYSTDAKLLAEISGNRFEIVYVDGDHREATARHDFAHFGAKVEPGGWLIADDAAADLPGSTFWKGFPEVTTALDELPRLGFVNIFNVGHNRVFERQS